MSLQKYLQHYLIAVKHPELSGFEYLEMLMVRDEVETQVLFLDDTQKALLAKADQRLFTQAVKFNTALSQITTLSYEREQRQPSPEQWWWYLDVLATVPSIDKPILEAEI